MCVSSIYTLSQAGFSENKLGDGRLAHTRFTRETLGAPIRSEGRRIRQRELNRGTS